MTFNKIYLAFSLMKYNYHFSSQFSQSDIYLQFPFAKLTYWNFTKTYKTLYNEKKKYSSKNSILMHSF